MVAEVAFGHTATILKEMMGKVSNKLYPEFLLSEILKIRKVGLKGGGQRYPRPVLTLASRPKQSSLGEPQN